MWNDAAIATNRSNTAVAMATHNKIAMNWLAGRDSRNMCAQKSIGIARIKWASWVEVMEIKYNNKNHYVCRVKV